MGPFPQPDAPGQVSSDLIPWESIHGAHAPETAGQGDVDDGSADAAEIKYPAVEAFAPPSRGIVYPEVKPVMVGAEEQHDDEGASPAQIGIQMERLPVSRSASMMTSASYMASSSGPFNYEEGFQEAMTIRENEGQTEDGFVVV